MTDPVLPGLFDVFVETVRQPIQERDRILKSLIEQQRDDFMANASACILEALSHGQASGEWLTQRCKAMHIYPVGDDRAFGPVYMKLARAGLIEKVATVRRERGHGTSGGNVWRRR